MWANWIGKPGTCSCVAADRRRAHLILLSGDAGVGKSRLAAEIAAVATREHDADVLSGQCMPYDEESSVSDIEQALGALDGFGFIKRYERDGKKLLWIPTFCKYQKISNPGACPLKPPENQGSDKLRMLGNQPTKAVELTRSHVPLRIGRKPEANPSDRGESSLGSMPLGGVIGGES